MHIAHVSHVRGDNTFTYTSYMYVNASVRRHRINRYYDAAYESRYSVVISVNTASRRTHLPLTFKSVDLRFALAIVWFLANVRYMLSPVRLSSVVCNVRAPYSGGSNFRQYFYGIRYLGHPLTSTENATEIVSGEPLRRG